MNLWFRIINPNQLQILLLFYKIYVYNLGHISFLFYLKNLYYDLLKHMQIFNIKNLWLIINLYWFSHFHRYCSSLGNLIVCIILDRLDFVSIGFISWFLVQKRCVLSIIHRHIGFIYEDFKCLLMIYHDSQEIFNQLLIYLDDSIDSLGLNCKIGLKLEK